MTLRPLLVAVAVALWGGTTSPPAHAARPWRITAGLDVGARRERLEVDLGSAHYQEDRSLTTTRFGLGLRAPWVERGGWALSGQSQLGVGWVFETGHPNVALHQAALLEHLLAHGFALPFGLGLGVVIDTASTSRSALEMGLPMGVRYRGIELLWQPSLVMPLGHEQAPVFGGEKRLGAAPGIVGLAFIGRVLL